MMNTHSCYLVFLVIISLHHAMVFGDGSIRLKFRRYENPSGKGANGHCCDGKWGICTSKCDHRFTVCLDDGTSNVDMDQCSLGKYVSNDVDDQNIVEFEDTIADLQNPLLFNFQGHLTKRAMTLKVEVYDDDVRLTRDDFVDLLRTTFDPANIPVDTGQGQSWSFMIMARTKLLAELSLRCSVNFYGSRCGTYCANPGQSDHYHCHLVTGRKICEDGWEGRECDRQMRPTTSAINIVTTSTTTPAPTTSRPSGRTTTPFPLFPDTDNADCDRVATNGHRYQDGVYTIQVSSLPAFEVYCDMSAEGWTLIQQRVDGSVDFNRGYEDYKRGFGSPGVNSEYWMGLERLYHLTNQRSYKMRISMQLGNGEFRNAEYNHFWIEDEKHGYKLHTRGFSGTARDALHVNRFGGTRDHQGIPFSTPDRDNDMWEDGNCAQLYMSGWWFNDCYWANLNGPYVSVQNGWPPCPRGKCITWRSIGGYEDYSLTRVKMMLLPNPRY